MVFRLSRPLVSAGWPVSKAWSRSALQSTMLACQADLARVKGVGGVFATLLQKAGVTKVGLMSDPKELGLGPEGDAE